MAQSLLNHGYTERGLPDLDAAVSRAAQWFQRTWLEKPDGSGWAHYEGLDHPTEWGGTLDGLRALARLNTSQYDPRVTKSLNWLKKLQQSDGGWGSWEIKQSCVEATSWVLITLKMFGHDASTDAVKKSSAFLKANSTTVDAQMSAWGAYEGAPLRTYPTLLAVWALHGIDDSLSAQGAEWLKRAVNSDGGWGFLSRDDASNIAMTAMSLYGLLVTKHLAAGPLFEHSMGWIRRARKPDGTWLNVTEDWLCYVDAQGVAQPTQTRHYATPWALMALIKGQLPVTEREILQSATVLCVTQADDGAWVLYPEDPKRHTWAVANALWALLDARDAFFSSAGFSAYVDRSVTRNVRRLTLLSAITLVLLVASIVGFAIYLSGAYHVSAEVFVRSRHGVEHNAREVLIGVIASAVFGVLLGAAGFARRAIKIKKRSQGG